VPWGIGQFLGGLLLVWIAAFSSAYFVLMVEKELSIPSLELAWGIVAAIFITTILALLWMIRRYSPSISTILQLMLAAALSTVTFFVLAFVVLFFFLDYYVK
jgi:hypothetical protein